jgi:hypothetical protein
MSCVAPRNTFGSGPYTATAPAGCRSVRSGSTRQLANPASAAARQNAGPQAEEEFCYLPLFGAGAQATERLRDSIADHDDIRGTIGEAAAQPVGSAPTYLSWSSRVRRVSMSPLIPSPGSPKITSGPPVDEPVGENVRRGLVSHLYLLRIGGRAGGT